MHPFQPLWALFHWLLNFGGFIPPNFPVYSNSPVHLQAHLSIIARPFRQRRYPSTWHIYYLHKHLTHLSPHKFPQSPGFVFTFLLLFTTIHTTWLFFLFFFLIYIYTYIYLHSVNKFYFPIVFAFVNISLFFFSLYRVINKMFVIQLQRIFAKRAAMGISMIILHGYFKVIHSQACQHITRLAKSMLN